MLEGFLATWGLKHGFKNLKDGVIVQELDNVVTGCACSSS